MQFFVLPFFRPSPCFLSIILVINFFFLRIFCNVLSLFLVISMLFLLIFLLSFFVLIHIPLVLLFPPFFSIVHFSVSFVYVFFLFISHISCLPFLVFNHHLFRPPNPPRLTLVSSLDFPRLPLAIKPFPSSYLIIPSSSFFPQ